MKNSNMEKSIIDISTLTLIKVAVIFVLIVTVFYLRDIFLIIFISLILAAAFDPWVDWLQKHKLPRGVAMLLIYLLAFLILGSVVYLIIPPIMTEINQLTNDFPAYWEKLQVNFESFQIYSQSHGWDQNIQGSLEYLQSNIGAAAGGVFTTVFSLFGGIVSFFIILVITFYMAVEEQALKRVLRSIVPIKYQPYTTHLVNRMQERIGYWLRGQLVLSLIMMVMVWAGLSILGVKYALVLAIFAGVTELVPYLGPFMGAIPAVFIAFTQSPFLALLVIALYIVIQFVDNHVTVPKVMQKATGLNPVVTIIVLLIGAKLAGFVGIILAVPVTTALSVLVNDLMESKKS